MIQTYGKQNLITRTYYGLRYSRKPNPYTIKKLDNAGIGIYIPKIKKHKLILGTLGIIACCVPGLPLPAIPFIGGWMLK